MTDHTTSIPVYHDVYVPLLDKTHEEVVAEVQERWPDYNIEPIYSLVDKVMEDPYALGLDF